MPNPGPWSRWWLRASVAYWERRASVPVAAGDCFYDTDGYWYRVERVDEDGLAHLTVVSMDSAKRTTAVCNVRLLALVCDPIPATEFPCAMVVPEGETR